ncbi:MAG TPA: condensation domain-containing protein, partial [Pseudonocardiaceae bacterium]|nr:condensation domain-containing protein [Pseudonocardiaceae bacterium]
MTVNELPSARKRALLADALRRRNSAPSAYPLSFGQQRLWFLEKFSPGQAVYAVPIAVRLVGPLDVAALRASLDAIVARHASLRTTFPDQGGEPVQVVSPHGSAAFEFVRRPVPPPQREEQAQRFSNEQAMIGFNLERGPLMRATLAEFGEDDHVLVVNLHHIVSDAWSLSVLASELTTLYGAHVAGTEPRLPDLDLQYPDFAVWQRDQMRAERANQQLDHWVEHLAGAPAVLTLPTDRQRPAVQSYRGALESATVPASLWAALEAMCRARGATPFMALLAAFTALLGRLAGQDDVVIGTPVAGRSDANLERLIGFFVNTLPLRVSTSGDPTFAELLDRAKRTTLDGLANADVPFERLVERLHPQRSLGHSPVFQAQLILQNTPPAPLRLAGLTATGLLPDPGVAKFDVTLAVEPRRAGRNLALEYNTDLFDRQTVEFMLEQFVGLLTDAVADADRPVSTLAPLTGLRRWQLVVGNNDTRRPLPPVATAVDLVSWASAGPAVSGAGAGALTYGELDEVSNRLAHVLVEAGVGPDVPVALCLDRSPAMVSAMLAVWKAGGCYLPLDPTWPQSRLRLMVEDAEPAVLITHRALGDRLAGLLDGTSTVTVCLDESAGRIAAAPATRPTLVAPPTQDHLAYLIYTSGSTGRPKGVGVPHRGVVNLLSSFAELLGVETGDRLAAVTTLSFDISVLELLLPLVAGGTVHVVDAVTAADGPALRRLLVDRGITMMQATPATWRLLQSAGGPPPAVLVRLCGGEALPRDLAGDLQRDGGLLWNVYGPTETTVWSAAGPVEPA